MTKSLPKLLGAACIAALLTAPATAQQWTSQIVIDQVQLGRSDAVLNVHVPEGTTDLAATASSYGNEASGLIGAGDIDFDAVQRNDCCTTATATIAGQDRIYGTASINTTAYGNTANAGSQHGSSFYFADQTTNGGTHASTTIDLGSVNVLNSATTAAANLSVSGAENGDNRAFQKQASNGSVSASTLASVCCTTSSATFTTEAYGNAAQSTGRSATSYSGAVQTTANDQWITSYGDVYMQGGTNVTSASSASGNAYLLDNKYGYATLGRDVSKLYQGNESNVAATSVVELDHWSGRSAAIASGVGNRAEIINTSSDTGLNAIQGNYGDVSASADFSGQAWTGGIGSADAMAIGNDASATLCDVCGDAALTGNISQMNAGNIYATSTTYVPYSGGVTSSATAIGNSATFSAIAPKE